jgi:hypothetical protein
MTTITVLHNRGQASEFNRPNTPFKAYLPVLSLPFNMPEANAIVGKKVEITGVLLNKINRI